MIGNGMNRGTSLWMLGAMVVGAGVVLAGANPSNWSLAGLAPPAEMDGENPADPDAPSDADAGPPLRKLTAQEINRIRFLELRVFRRRNEDIPDKVKVKLSRDTVESFLKKDLKDTPEFRDLAGTADLEAKLEKEQQEFRKFTAPKKLHYLAKFTGTRYIDEVNLLSDPEIFEQFKKWVHPHVLKTCATAECHGATNEHAPIFRLYNETKRSPETLYANFIVLNELTVEDRPGVRGGPLIDRDAPTESLLLRYLLAPKMVAERDRHPGNVKYRPPFNSEGALVYKRIGEWIGGLRHPAEDYGVHILTAPENAGDEDKSAATQPAKNKPGSDKKKPSDAGATGGGKDKQ